MRGAPVFDASVYITFRADHTLVSSGYGLGGKSRADFGAGRWRVDGNQLVTRFEGKDVRARIVKITAKELQIEESPGKIFTYKRAQ